MQNKCVPYWPDLQSSKEMGPYVVTYESEREAADYKVRILEIASVHKVTSEHLPLTSLPSLLSVHVLCGHKASIRTFYFCIRIHFLLCSRKSVVPSGTISTWVGPITASLRSQVVSSASSLKWTLNRLNILVLDPWSSTAGTSPLQPKCLNEPGGKTLDCRYLGGEDCDSLEH